jgi:hypothetical protein
MTIAHEVLLYNFVKLEIKKKRLAIAVKNVEQFNLKITRKQWLHEEIDT